jgi:membrane protease YdiL (CAAX protease family)
MAPILKRRHPSFRSALILFAIILTVLLVSSPTIGRLSIDRGILISEFLIILVPSAAFLALHRINAVRFLNLTRISLGTAVGTIMTAVSGIILTGELVALQNEIVPIPAEYLDILRSFFVIAGKMSVPWAILTFAVVPALCEEILFRGILLRTAMERMPPTGAVILTGFFFGLFHLDPFRLIGTAVLGCIMGYIVVRTRSLFSSMIYHLTNNLMILLVVNQSSLSRIPWLAEEGHPPPAVIALALVGFALGLRLLSPNNERRDREIGNIHDDES